MEQSFQCSPPRIEGYHVLFVTFGLRSESRLYVCVFDTDVALQSLGGCLDIFCVRRLYQVLLATRHLYHQ